jgi:hypothetical protein
MSINIKDHYSPPTEVNVNGPSMTLALASKAYVKDFARTYTHDLGKTAQGPYGGTFITADGRVGTKATMRGDVDLDTCHWTATDNNKDECGGFFDVEYQSGLDHSDPSKRRISYHLVGVDGFEETEGLIRPITRTAPGSMADKIWAPPRYRVVPVQFDPQQKFYTYKGDVPAGTKEGNMATLLDGSKLGNLHWTGEGGNYSFDEGRGKVTVEWEHFSRDGEDLTELTTLGARQGTIQVPRGCAGGRNSTAFFAPTD